MKINLIFTFILGLFLAACNVAEQSTPRETLNDSLADEGSEPDQSISFSNSFVQRSESLSAYSLLLNRKGNDLSQSQDVYIKLGGSADIDDLSAFTINGLTPVIDTNNIFIVNFASNERVKQVVLELNDDNIYEDDESLSLTILTNGNDYMIETHQVFRLQINDNDPYPVVSFQTINGAITEGTQYSLTVSVSNLHKENIIVPIVFDNSQGIAKNGSDISFSTQYLTFNQASGTSQSITVSTIDDGFNELTENAFFIIPSAMKANVGVINSHELMINDNDSAASYSLGFSTATVSEASNTSVTLTLNGNIENEIKVPFTLTPGLNTPLQGSDYSLDSSEFIFPAGSLSGTTSTIIISAIDDDLFEGSESFNLVLNSSGFANIGAIGAATITISDNGETIPDVSIAGENYQISEGATFQLPFFLTQKSAYPITLNYTATGTATATSDYSLSSTGTITIPAGVLTYNFPIFILPDNTFDQGETLILSITEVDPNANIVGATDSTTITLNELGSIATISFNSQFSNIPEGDSAELSFTLSKRSENIQSFEIDQNLLSASGIDILALSSINTLQCTITGLTISILPNQTQCTIEIPLVDDDLDEPTEQVSFRILQPSNLELGDITTHTLSISDTDAASTVRISLTDPAESVTATMNEGTSQQIFLKLDKVSAYDIKVNLLLNVASTASDNLDFYIPSYIVTIPAGTLTQSFDVTTILDSLFETAINEKIIIDISSGSNYLIDPQNSIELDIIDLTGSPIISIKDRGAGDLIKSENEDVDITFQLDHVSTEDITFTFTTSCPGTIGFSCATLPNDSQELADHSGVITIPAGSLEATLNFELIADNLYELLNDEEVLISINAVTSGMAAIIPSPNDEIRVVIKDADIASEARFTGTKVINIAEGSDLTVSIPLSLSTPSEGISTFRVDIVQSSEALKEKPDENDFVVSGDPGFIASSYLDGVTKNTGVSVNASTRSPLTYSGDSDVIFTKIISIPAGSSDFNIDFKINNTDTLYEGDEQFLIRVSEDDTFGAGYLYTVNSVHDTFVVNIIEDLPTPIVSFNFPTTITTVDEDNSSPITANEINNLSYNSPLIINDPNMNNINFDFTISSFHQHQDITFELNFSGTAEYTALITTSSQYLLGDYQVFLPTPSGDIIRNSASNSYTYTVPSSLTDDPLTLSQSVQVQIAKDIRYEEPDTIIATFDNLVNASINSNSSHTLTIEDTDEVKPEVIMNFNGGVSSIFEYEYENSASYSIRVGTAGDYFSGIYASSVPIEVVQTLDKEKRHEVVTLSTALPDFTLNSANSFAFSQSLNPSVTGDYRLIKELTLNITPDANAVNSSLFSQTLTVDVPQLEIYASKAKSIDPTTGQYSGHTCTIFRGRVMCFGENEFGQLGREDTVDFGTNPSDDLSLLSNAIDLGTDQFGLSLYAVDLSLGYGHTCALFNNKLIKCWGINSSGQLGLGDSLDRGNSPGTMGNNLPFVDLGTNIEALSIASSNVSNCAIISGTNEIRCWGGNLDRETGNDLQAGSSPPSSSDNIIGNLPDEMGDNLTVITLPNTPTLLSGGGKHFCATTVTNNLHCWGSNSHGQLGQNTIDTHHSLTSIDFPNESIILDSPITNISLGPETTCVSYEETGIHNNFNTRCFGNNESGQLGLGRVSESGSIGSGIYTSIASGTNYTSDIGKSSGANPSGRLITSSGVSSEDTAVHSNIPSNFVSNDLISIANNPVDRNQYVQIREPAQSIATGDTYGCGVYSHYFDRTGTRVVGINIKCWGANEKNSGVSTAEIGVLNNIGSQDSFNGNYDGGLLIPYAISGINTPLSQEKNFIGDNAASITGDSDGTNAFVYDHFNTDGNPATSYTWGWVSGFFQDSGVFSSLNFELNYYYSMSRESSVILSTLTDIDPTNDITDIKLSGGEHHVCAVLERGLLNSDSELQDKYEFMCWGANASGQTGHLSTTCPNIGGSTTCENTPLTRHKLSYTFL